MKYGFAKELLKKGAESPEHLYDYFEQWTQMLKDENNILRWTAIDIIGYLSSVDESNKTEQSIPDLIQLLHSGHLITCNHAIFALGLIAQNKPKHRKKILTELVAISNDEFESEECKNIATGKVIESFNFFLDDIKDDKPVINFIRAATRNSRNATKQKAERLISKIEKLKRSPRYE